MRKKLPPFAKQTRVPGDNETIFVHVGWISWEQANDITKSRGMIYPADTDPSLFLWPVKGCGVVILDHHGLDSGDVEKLDHELMISGATDTQYVEFA
jgi:hypothetical protein